MKKVISIILSAIMLFTLLPMSVGAVYTEDKIWEYNVLSDGTVEIDHYRGDETVINIPTEIDGYTVSYISYNAFYYSQKITSVYIPECITRVSSGAFDDCDLLNDINVAEGNENYCSVDGVLFTKDMKTICHYPQNRTGTYTVPDGVTEIEMEAFKDSKLSEVILPEGITIIYSYAFQYSNIEKIEIHEGVKYISDNAFSYCKSLKSVVLPESLIGISYDAFYGCSSLEDITLHDNIMGIGDCAFVGTAYYYNPENWEDGVLYLGNCLLDYSRDADFKSYKIKDGTTVIANCAFEFCDSLEEVSIPESVKYIGYHAFRRTGLTNNPDNYENGLLYVDNCLIATDNEYNWEEQKYITTVPDDCKIKEGTRLLADDIFGMHETLKSITVPRSVKIISDSAFYYCTALESITLEEGVEYISDGAFRNCTALTSITIPKSVTYIDDNCGLGYVGYYESEIEDFTIYGYVGTEGQRYAEEWGFNFVDTENLPEFMLGDVNTDGNVTIVDAKWVLQYVAGSKKLTSEQKTAADVNKDGNITIVDAKWILQSVAGTRDLNK